MVQIRIWHRLERKRLADGDEKRLPFRGYLHDDQHRQHRHALNISGTSSRTVSTGGVINNAGNATWSGTGGLSLNGGGIINNTGTFNITNDLTDGAGGTFNNIGTLNKTAGAGDGISHMTWAFNNSGTVNVNSGGIEVQAGGAANSGTFNTVAGTSVIFEPGNLSQFNT